MEDTTTPTSTPTPTPPPTPTVLPKPDGCAMERDGPPTNVPGAPTNVPGAPTNVPGAPIKKTRVAPQANGGLVPFSLCLGPKKLIFEKSAYTLKH